jgi:monothiol glutaredoxin
MKGSPQAPMCGFSARAVQCLNNCNIVFATIDILENPEIRKLLPQYSDWPTFPQLYVKGELIGGSDIIAEMYEHGELEPLLKEAVSV